jgi:DNA-binding beta-propeller fold protein YncE
VPGKRLNSKSSSRGLSAKRRAGETLRFHTGRIGTALTAYTMTSLRIYCPFLSCCFFVIAVVSTSLFAQQTTSSAPETLPTGMVITPTAARGSVFQPLNPDLPDFPQFTADHPVSTAVSPDGGTLLILTSGFNRNNGPDGKRVADQSSEYVFVYDIRHQPPVKKQVLKIPNSFVGLAWNPDGKHFYASGGSNDNVHVFSWDGSHWSESPEPIALGHSTALGHRNASEGKTKSEVAGLAVDSSGKRLLAVNYENDSVSLVDLDSGKKTAEFDLRPGKIDPAKKGVPGGEYPFWAVFKGDDKAYVSSLRDREIVVLDLTGTPKVASRIKIHGQPNKLILNHAQTLLFAAVDNSDSLDMIDTSKDQVVAAIKTTAPASIFPNKGTYKGSNPNSLALSPDEHTIYVTNGGTNSVAVINLAQDPDDSQIVGLIPTGWYPSSISLNHDGSVLYVVNGKGNAGPNPKGCRSAAGENTCNPANQYILQLVKGGFLTLPRPSAAQLKELTQQVARNNHFLAEPVAPAPPVFSFLRSKIKHVIYIVKENRTYDQVLGDLEKGNGDPSLTLFKEPITPNHHQLARQFVTLDNFFDSGEVSGNGWNWSTAARATDNVEKTIAVNYGQRGFDYDFEGVNRNINVSGATFDQRKTANPALSRLADPEDQLPGTADVAAPDGPEDETGAGYLWDSALRAGLTIRNYGFYCDLTRYSEAKESPAAVPLLHDPASSGTTVAFAANVHLQAVTDPYFRSFDQSFPDYWRYKEWEREFDEFAKKDDLPTLELLRINHDHFGSFGSAIDGINTVEKEMADNDYALGLVAEKVAHSKYSQDTLIFVVEDDAQNGPDHMDAHRSIAYVIGPYVKQGAVVSQRYNTVSMLRTIEEVLGIKPLGLNDAVQPPMAEVFSTQATPWTYQARVPALLRSTQLPLPPAPDSSPGGAVSSPPTHGAQYWEAQTAGLDFSAEDRVDSERFNLILWQGIMGEDHPYPAERSGLDLRKNRKELLKARPSQ